MSPPLRIGVSACIFHADPTRAVFSGKPLYYLERSMADFLGSRGALVYVIPPPCDDRFAAYVDDLDGLVLSGGADVAPSSYGASAARPEWAGDAERDRYELGLLGAALERDKPVLGICRGHQLLNVGLGGTLHQDIATYIEGARVHRDAARYDHNEHLVTLEGELARWFGVTRGLVNSVHHQSIDVLGAGLVACARADDGVIEAVVSTRHRWVRGVQWHPEFRFGDPTLLDQRRLLDAFLHAANEGRNAVGARPSECANEPL